MAVSSFLFLKEQIKDIIICGPHEHRPECTLGHRVKSVLEVNVDSDYPLF
jgi:hypothetical protein